MYKRTRTLPHFSPNYLPSRHLILPSARRPPPFPTSNCQRSPTNHFPRYTSPPPTMAPPSSSSSDSDSDSRPHKPAVVEETLISLPSAILHLIDPNRSVHLAFGDLTVLRLLRGDTPVAVLARVSPDLRWPLTKDVAAVRLDSSHYFFTIPVPDGDDGGGPILSYGLTLAPNGAHEPLLEELDAILDQYTSFSVHKVEVEVEGCVPGGGAAAGGGVGREEMEREREAAAYWTTLAPNVEEYGGCVARAIAKGSGQVVKGILWCGEVAAERLRWGEEVLMQRLAPAEKDAEVRPETMKRIKRVKNVTKMSEKVATGILSGVVKVSGYFTSSVANSKPGKKFLDLLPGEIVLASLDGFSKICDAAEVAGKNVLTTSSTVTTGLVSHRYGEQAAQATNESLNAAGHVAGAAWAVFKIRKVMDPRSSLRSTTLAKSTAKATVEELRGKQK